MEKRLGNSGHRRGAGEVLVGEGPQVFERADAAGAQDDLAEAVAIGGPEGAHEFGGCTLVLDLAGVDAYLRARLSPPEGCSMSRTAAPVGEVTMLMRPGQGGRSC